jgi:superfamily II DNA or RNA helicase
MYLSRLGGDVSPNVKANGEKLYWRNRVRIQRGNIREVNAEVEDGIIHSVRLVREGRTVLAQCQCPAAVDLGVCVHIWAALLQAERLSYLGGTFQDGLPEILASVHGAVGPAAEKGTWGAAFHSLRPPPFVPQSRREREAWPLGREIRYLIQTEKSLVGGGGMCLQVQVREPKRDGSFGKTKSVTLFRNQIDDMPDAQDREIFTILAGVPNADQFVSELLPSEFSLMGPSGRKVGALVCATGRCFLADSLESSEALRWAGDVPAEFRMVVTKDEEFWVIEGILTAGDQRIPLGEIRKAAGGLFVTKDWLGALDLGHSGSWLEMLRKNEKLTAPLKNGIELLAQVMSRDDHPKVEWHPELEFQDVRIKPRPWFVVQEGGSFQRTRNASLFGTLTFLYDDTGFRYGQASRGIYVASRRMYVHRDAEAESAALEKLKSMRMRPAETYIAHEMVSGWEIPRKRLPEIVSHLTAAGWKVEVSGKQFRQSVGFKASITSQIDWFELEGGLEFGSGEIVRMPELLKALRRGESMVELSDGSFGLVPQEVMDRFASLVQLAHTEEGQVRFKRNQTGLLDALLAERPEIGFDTAFGEARERIRNFEKVKPAEQPAGFTGTLREYQREGVGWMQFLQKLGMGGCLADDMGVGKTPQMLALLETRRAFRPDIPPSLVVVPRSLVYNWQQEAAKFTPQLRVLDHTGADRNANWDRMQDYDLVLSTYGTLRRDAADFRSFEFDYVILDEAQAIKNPNSESAKAARLLNGRHRMVLTGTPIENHLGELWSLVEFLNPGMLGAAVFQNSGASLRNPDEETRVTLARALKPFILRRTKEQVARELPSKIEQTVYCELEGDQKKLYTELRDHYRQTLLGKIDKQGMAKSKLQVLEALLRLRQAACHPGLIDKARTGEGSAKLETLLDQIQSVSAEGHKALVFSQFTSLLAIVSERLNEAGITFEYLDGRTRNRQARVERFQGDPNCPVFLISLKAGGVGLNLTAADYVFLLDPWWNPAVEAQAVDRAHRIGQTKQVFAYRLIAKDTVEEKVLLLQEHKKDLADAIIQADEGMVKSLQREDLEILLS